jgi:hypothetical protein
MKFVLNGTGAVIAAAFVTPPHGRKLWPRAWTIAKENFRTESEHHSKNEIG